MLHGSVSRAFRIDSVGRWKEILPNVLESVSSSSELHQCGKVLGDWSTELQAVVTSRLRRSRLFSTASDGAEGSIAKAKALPFSVDRDQAAAALRDYHSGVLTSPTLWQTHKCKEAFLPFWVGAFEISVNVRQADVGYQRLVHRYNPFRRTTESRYETLWQTVPLGYYWERRYAPEDAGMQVYASYKYPRVFIDHLCPGPAITKSVPLTPDLLQCADTDTVRRVGAFTMKPDTAHKFMEHHMQGTERKAAEEIITQEFNCDSVRSIDLNITIRYRNMYPMYVPVFVYSTWRFRTKLRSFVAGYDVTQVTGTHLYEPVKVAALTSVGAFASMLLTGVFHIRPMSELLWSAVLPGLVTGAIAWVLPMFVQEALQMADQFRQQYWHTSTQASGEWDPEYVRTYTEQEDYHRASEDRQNYQERRSRQFSWPGSTPSDPKGYYKLLGVSVTATKQEIQAAFRGLVLQHHPDRVKGEAAKQQATKSFQSITEAYQVLRDPRKRREYDSRGYDH